MNEPDKTSTLGREKGKSLPPITFLKEALTYDPATGVLRWRNDRPRHHFNSDRGMNISNSSYGGSEAGRMRMKNGRPHYIIVGLSYGRYYAHRLAWVFMTGEDVPAGMQIDHINHNTIDNRACNLQLVTNQENGFNSGRRRGKNGHLPRGVQERENGRFSAKLRYNGKWHQLGTHDTADLASEARKKRAEELGIRNFKS